LLEYWEGRCAITGLDIPTLLCASHIKPWAECRTDAERLDIFNGLLLAPHFDALFDKGFITVTDAGEIDISPRLSREHRKCLGLDLSLELYAWLMGISDTFDITDPQFSYKDDGGDVSGGNGGGCYVETTAE